MPEIAVCQSSLYRQGRRLRGQARSHILPCVHQVEIRDTCWGQLGLGSCANRQDRHHSNVGAGLPAIAVCQSPLYRQGRRLRGQARSHILLCVHQVKIRGNGWAAGLRVVRKPSRPPPFKCGSWLACDSGVSVTLLSTGSPPSRASPLPHFALRMSGNSSRQRAGRLGLRSCMNTKTTTIQMWELACLR